MKVVENYNNFDIKVSKLGRYFIYSDSGLSEYCKVSFRRYFETIEDAKKAIDKYWEDMNK